MSESSPLLLFIFSNDQDNYLKAVPAEKKALKKLVTPVSRKWGLQAEFEDYITPTEVIDYITNNKKRLVVLHFAGHSDEDVLELDNGKLHSMGFTDKLAECENLQLVFLNGCKNLDQVALLLSKTNSAVIGTYDPIPDELASSFSKNFYKSFVVDRLSIAEAFGQAKKNTQPLTGKKLRSPDFSLVKNKSVDEWFWFLERPDTTWKLEEAINPCLLLPDLTKEQLENFPKLFYKSLTYYEKKDSNIFFGRCKETLELLKIINEKKESIILLHGDAGVGKSSFLQAGLTPRLEAIGYEVEYIRYGEAEPELTIMLNEAFSKKENGKFLFIVDQYEEVFADDSGESKVRDFLLLVNEKIIRNRGKITYFQLIISLRTEWFGKLEDVCGDIFDFYLYRKMIKPFSRKAIIEIVEAPENIDILKEKYKIKIDNDDGKLSGHISQFVLEDKHSNVAPTLQTILYKLWDNAKKKYQKEEWIILKSSDFLEEKKKGLGLVNYINRGFALISESGDVGKKANESGLLLSILRSHTSEEEIAISLPNDKLKLKYPHIKSLDFMLSQLEKNFLLIRTSNSTRIAHDSLIPIINRLDGKSSKAGQRARRIIDSKFLNEEKSNFLFDSNDLDLIFKGSNGGEVYDSQIMEAIDISYKHQKSETRNVNFLLAGFSFFVIALCLAFLTGKGVSFP